MTIINIIAIILSPIIAITIGELLRKRNFKKQKRLEILYDLVAYRDRVHSIEFLKAINSLKFFFFKDKELKRISDELYDKMQKRDQGLVNSEEVDNLITKTIRQVCILEGFRDLTEADIKKLFTKKS